MFNEIKEELTRKICELRLWLSNINDSDDFSAINKGLFYVYIYGIYEETVRTVVQKTIEELNAKSVKLMSVYMSCMHSFFPRNMTVYMVWVMNISGKKGGIFQIN